MSLFEQATCHLQLGKQLHDAGRFSRSDFLMLLATETRSLEECIACLKHSKEGTQEAIIQYREQGATLESEHHTRFLQHDSYISPQEAKNLKTAADKNNVSGISIILDIYLIELTDTHFHVCN